MKIWARECRWTEDPKKSMKLKSYNGNSPLSIPSRYFDRHHSRIGMLTLNVCVQPVPLSHFSVERIIIGSEMSDEIVRHVSDSEQCCQERATENEIISFHEFKADYKFFSVFWEWKYKTRNECKAVSVRFSNSDTTDGNRCRVRHSLHVPNSFDFNCAPRFIIPIESTLRKAKNATRTTHTKRRVKNTFSRFSVHSLTTTHLCVPHHQRNTEKLYKKRLKKEFSETRERIYFWFLILNCLSRFDYFGFSFSLLYILSALRSIQIEDDSI